MLNFIISNWQGILLSSFVAVLVAGIWYSPPVLGRTWQKLLKIKDKDLRTLGALNYVVAFAMILLTALVLKRFLIITNPQNVYEAIKVAVWIWLGFVVTYVVAGGIFEKVKPKIMAIDLSGQLLILMSMSVVLYYL